jgi:putative DNA primase/helicase
MSSIQAKSATVIPMMTTLKLDKPTYEWGTVEPLMTANGGASYPVDALPQSLKDAVLESTNIVKCPTAMAASSALATLATACQGIANIQPNQNLKPSPLSLFFMQIAKSGERKSTIDSLFTESIKAWSQRKKEELKTEYLQAESTYKSWSCEVEGVTSAIKHAATKGQDTSVLASRLRELESNPPTRGRLPKMTYSDTTPEALLYGLGHKWASAAVLSSEGGVIFGGHGMNSESITRI